MRQVVVDDLARRLEAYGTRTGRHMEQQYGARGIAPRAFYFKGPDGNVLEARYYDD